MGLDFNKITEALRGKADSLDSERSQFVADLLPEVLRAKREGGTVAEAMNEIITEMGHAPLTAFERMRLNVAVVEADLPRPAPKPEIPISRADGVMPMATVLPFTEDIVPDGYELVALTMPIKEMVRV